MQRLTLFFACLLFFSLPVAFAQTSDFSIIVLPDTQNESQFFPSVLDTETQWIVNNRAALNIQAVVGVGDIVNDGASDAQMQNADAAYRLLDNAGIPYFATIGNHDYDGAMLTGVGRSASDFNHYFGPLRYSGKAYYRGNFPSGSNENFYGVLTIGGKAFLFLALEFVPRSTTLDWAESIMSANPDISVILVTHSFLYNDGTRVDRCDTQDLARDNDGDEMWVRLRKHSNLIMTLNGHLTGGETAHRSDVADNGNLVNQIFTNMQTETNGGNGWLRILTFHPASNSISVRTFSPFLNASRTDAANQFTIPYHRPAITSTTGTLSGRVRNTSGCASIAGVTVKVAGLLATTGTDGRYSIPGVPAGAHTASVSKSGWLSQSKSDIVHANFATDLNFYITASGTAPCTLNTASPSVTICTPANNASVTSPVHIVAGTRDSVAVSFIQVYVDGVAKFTKTGGGTLDTSVAMAAGTRRVTVQAKDANGTFFRQTIFVSVK